MRKLDEVTNWKCRIPNRNQRVQIYSESQFAEEVNPPLHAPKWTRSGYNGPLKRLVVSEDEEDHHTEPKNTNNGRKKKKRK